MPVVRKNLSAARQLAEAEARALHEKISGMAIEWVPIDSIKSNLRNAKEHPEHQIALLAENMRRFGVTQPNLIMTMIAAERTGRPARLIEIDPAYCDRIARRWQTMTGKQAQLAESQQTFAELEARRLGASGGRE